jgi:hypothetical protein
MISELLGMVIGFLAVAGTLLLLLVMVIMDNKTRRLRTKFLHDERMLALDKGLPVPMDYTELPKKRRPYVRGLVFVAVGLGFIVWGGMSDSSDVRGMGMLVLYVGIALIIADQVNERRSARLNKEKERYDAQQALYPDNRS